MTRRRSSSLLALLLAASQRHSMPRATKKLPLLFNTNEMVKKTSLSLSEGHLHDFAQGLFGIEERAGGKYCATTTHCSEGFWAKPRNNCHSMIVLILFSPSIDSIYQWPFQDPRLEVPTIYKAYFLGLCKGISPQNMSKNIVRLRTSILGSWRSPIESRSF